MGTVAALVFVGVLWNSVGHASLALWGALAAVILAARWWLVARHAKVSADLASSAVDTAEPHLELFDRYQALWPATAFLWGSTVALHYNRVPLAEQFTCWLVLAGLGMFSINSMAAHLHTLRVYLNTLALTVLTVMLWRSALVHGWEVPTYHFWLMALVLLYWAALRGVARRVHLTHRRNFDLQFRNQQLIASLTHQTRAALDAVQTKNRFLASAAHDLRQPVHALALYADWLRTEPELVSELAPKIVQSTRAVNALFDSLFDLARLDAGQQSLRVEEVDLGRLASELLTQFGPLAQAKGLDLRMHLPSETALEHIDPVMLRRILSNLLSNAVKYTARGGVLLAVRGTPGRWRCEVWDSGVGIAPAQQAEVFREFYKVPGHAGTDEGFGLGLYIVQRLCDILGHPLSLRSQPGRGSVFRVGVRLVDAAAARHRAEAAARQPAEADARPMNPQA